MKYIACYIRVSAIAPDLGQQKREINRWLKSNRINPGSVRWYIDKSTEDPRHRPRRDALQADIAHGQVRAVIVWHLDKLAGTTREGLKMLVEWCTKSLRSRFGQPRDRRQGYGLRHGRFHLARRGGNGRADQTRTHQSGLGDGTARGRAGGRPRMAADDAKDPDGERIAEKSLAQHRRNLPEARSLAIDVLSTRRQVGLQPPAGLLSPAAEQMALRSRRGNSAFSKSPTWPSEV